MDLAGAADELYGAPLTGFVAVRTRLEKQARTSGDRELATDVRALRKPSQAAWAVNQLVRHDRELLEDVLRLGDELRGAQHAGDTVALRRLTDRRHELIARVRRRAEELVARDGRQLGAAAAQALERTVGAAMSDPRTAEVVRSGLLVVDLENAGWGLVDLDGAQATVPAPSPDEPQPDEPQPDAAPLREAERAERLADEAAARAATALEQAEEGLEAASTEQHRLADRKAALLVELRQVEAGEERAAQEVRSARETRAAAAREVDRTERQATRARRHVEGLTSRT